MVSPVVPATIPVKKIPDAIEAITGNRPSYGSVKRWIREGFRGVKLQVGGPLHFRFTRQDWLDGFLAECGQTETPLQEDAISPRKLTPRESKKILAERYGITKFGNGEFDEEA